MLYKILTFQLDTSQKPCYRKSRNRELSDRSSLIPLIEELQFHTKREQDDSVKNTSKAAKDTVQDSKAICEVLSFTFLICAAVKRRHGD